MPIDPIDERFAFITREDGLQFQVLRYEVIDGVETPVDWDEAATALLMAEYEG